MDIGISSCSPRRASCSLGMTDIVLEYCSRSLYSHYRASCRFSAPACAVSAGLENVRVSASPSEDFSITTTTTSTAMELKIKVDVYGAKTQAIFDDVFSEMVSAAQPIPGFRRVKGGKTPNIPKDVLLHILGHSKVYMEVIKKIINSTVADYVEKEGLKVTSDLRVHQSFEELESTFEPGETFSLDAVIQLQGENV
ncbi:trigger factor isoform X3 [Macadamia integrifolia]|uniref:trigger factor isoform X3 n=1 Tax=Macadamia integrifolia TaxID=60698 RepID=UPI001C4E3E86|nr:trigger factor isoform X3 [Macadamia integrifolia]XP_042508244.1 trigger factor isoform X3 [Macadamia integrifolia]